MAPITIRGNVFDPANPGDINVPPTASDSNYILVQLDREMDQQTLEALQQHGATVIKRMVDNTWLAYYPPQDLRVLETEITAVSHAVVYIDHFVIHTNIKDNPAVVSKDSVEVSIALHEGTHGESDRVIAEIQQQGDAQVLSSANGIIHMSINPDIAGRVAAIDSVQAIEIITPAELYNDIAKETAGINKVNASLKAKGLATLTGDGQVVGVADTGVDATHPALSNKIYAKYYLEGPENDDVGHGTHVTGSILGDPLKSFNGKDCSGMAPAARLYIQGGIFRKKPSTPATTLLDKAYNLPGTQCRIHSNSWGIAYGLVQDILALFNEGKYSQFPYTIDDAEPVDRFLLEHPDFLVLYAAGNDGTRDTDTGAQVGAWAAAKNVLTVGAVNTNRPMSGDFKVDYSVDNTKLFAAKDPRAFRDKTMASFSSRGPCKDSRRTKPDVVAPGVGILSALSKDIPAAELKKLTDAFGEPPTGTGDDKTVYMSGTSMATPVVAGYATLLREALAKWQSMTQPTAPLMKALLINGTDVLPNVGKENQGFGQVNMEKVLRPVQTPITDISANKAPSGWAQDVANKNTGVIRVLKAVVPPADGKTVNIKVTLVYHDRPGDQIQNRMNLFVERNGKARMDTLPNTPNDNVHQLIINSLTPGEVLSIGVENKFFTGGVLPLQGSAPWAMVWDCFRT